MGMLRIALLFGSAAVAFALLVAPMIDQTRRSGYADGSAAGLDTISTGSVRATNSYTIRRSVLQPTPSSVCVIHDNGRRDGDC